MRNVKLKRKKFVYTLKNYKTIFFKKSFGSENLTRNPFVNEEKQIKFYIQQ